MQQERTPGGEARCCRPGSPRQALPEDRFRHPSSLDATNGTVWISDVHVSYTIPSPERVTKAELQLYNSASRVIARTDVPIQAKGDFDWNVGTNASIGPAVRLRASCPNGETDWVVLGLHIYPASTAQTYINNVTPKYIHQP